METVDWRVHETSGFNKEKKTLRGLVLVVTAVRSASCDSLRPSLLKKLEKVEINYELIERIVCQCWSFEGCLSLYVYHLFFLINWLLKDCSSWNMNVFILAVELIWFIPFQSVIISSYFFFFLLIVLFNTRKFTIFKVTRLAVISITGLRKKRKFHEISNFARNLV